METYALKLTSEDKTSIELFFITHNSQWTSPTPCEVWDQETIYVEVKTNCGSAVILHSIFKPQSFLSCGINLRP